MQTTYFSYLILGKKNQGKSSWFAERCKNVLAQNSKARILIIINNDPPSYDWIPRTDDFGKLAQFCNGGSGILKFYPPDDFSNNPEVDTLVWLSSRLRHAILGLEDVTAWLPPVPPKAAKNWIINHKNFDSHLFATAHSLIDVPSFFRRHTHRIVLFKTEDDLDFDAVRTEYIRKYPSYYSKLYKNWKEVRNALPVKGYIQPHKIFETGV